MNIDERLPLFICTRCSKKLTSANDFRKLCLKSYQFLIEIYENEAKRKSPKTVPEIPSALENICDKTPDEEEDEEELAIGPVNFLVFRS